MAFIAVEYPVIGTVRRAVVGVCAAVAIVLFLQPIFVASLAFVRTQTDLAAVRTSIADGFRTGLISADERPPSLIDRYGHQFTECAALHVSIDPEPSGLKAALLPQLHSRYVGPCGELERSAANVVTSDRTDYSRYWHGYRLYVWPMLDYFSLRTMRTVNAILLLAAAIFCFTGVRTTLGATAAAVFFIVLFSLTDIWRMWNITPHALSTALILFGTGLFARLYTPNADPAPAIVFAALFGAVFNFVDFLINPPLAPMLLAFIAVASQAQDTDLRSRRQIAGILFNAMLIAAAWFGGYALTWISKWILAIVASADGTTLWHNVAGQILLRLYGQEADAASYNIPLIPTLTVLVQSFISVGSIVVAILAAAIGLQVWKARAGFDARRFFILTSPSLIAMAWFELLSNHTQTHSHFTYRTESAVIALVFASAVLALREPLTLRELMLRLRAFVFGREDSRQPVVAMPEAIADAPPLLAFGKAAPALADVDAGGEAKEPVV